MLKCQFYEKSFPKLVKSHIIPRSFYKALRDESKPYSIYLEVGMKHNNEKYYQAGIHDSEIACETCEQLFNAFDTHGYQVLTKALAGKKIYHDHNGHPCAYFIENADYTKLKLFVLSMLWRAHASSHKFFSHVDLGPYATTLRSYIYSSTAPSSEEYGVVFFHRVSQQYPGILIPPWRDRIQGVNVYRFYLPDIIIIIKVDKRPMPKPFNMMMLKEASPHYIGLLPDINSSEKRYIEEMKKQLRENMQ